LSLSSPAFADLVNLSQYPTSNQTNQRAKISGVIQIPIQFSGGAYIEVQVAQADHRGFYTTDQKLAVDPTKQNYTILLDANQLLNGWANVIVSGAGAYFTFKFQVMNSSQQLTGSPASLILTP